MDSEKRCCYWCTKVGFNLDDTLSCYAGRKPKKVNADDCCDKFNKVPKFKSDAIVPEPDD